MKNTSVINLHQTGQSTTTNKMGMRPMQERVYANANSQYLLVKAPPASGKSRAAKYVALKKMKDGSVNKTIIAVPERSIGASFSSEKLTESGFFADWLVAKGYNLCAPGGEAGKIERLKRFLSDKDTNILVCTHATLRAAYAKVGAAAFQNMFIVIDEFHHVSEDVDNRLGELVRAFIAMGNIHVMAMTGSYFRGDRVPVLSVEDESNFTKVVYNYYEQLNGYKYLKSVGLGTHYYSTDYLAAIPEILDTDKKTILYIPNVNSYESTKDKYDEVGRIIDSIGVFFDEDDETGVITVSRHTDGKHIRIADLVEDNPKDRDRIVSFLQKDDGEGVDLIIALGMAKEGFDWPPCEHTIVVGSRGSLTEVVQIIGRCTRDYKNKYHAQYTNLVAVPDATREDVVIAVNNITKAIVASLLMEQVLEPQYHFKRRRDENDKSDGVTVYIEGYREPSTNKVKSIIDTDLPEVQEAVLQDPEVQKAMEADVSAEVINKVLIPKVIIEKYPDLTEDEREELRERIVAGFVLRESAIETDDEGNTVVIIRRNLNVIPVNVEDINMDLIDTVNPFMDQFEILSKDFTPKLLKEIKECIASYRIEMTDEEAIVLWPEVKKFVTVLKREPDIDSADPKEKRLAEALLYLRRARREASHG